MRIKITGIPELKMGGILADYPYAGSNRDANPFGNISSNDTTEAENINASAKPVEREHANMEAEKGELLLKYDLKGLFNIQGKRHSEGGTPLKADPGDFIFSRDKNLAITKDEKELFEFKEGGTYKKTENTPAKVLAREVNPKHYNQLINILNDPKADDIAKKTAELMLQKYMTKAGQVAFVQESKKGFPNGLPNFSQGTAPVQSTEFNDAEAKEQMYKKGGPYKNTYTAEEIAQMKANGEWDNPAVLEDYGNNFRKFDYENRPTDINSIQQFIVSNFPSLIQDSFANKGMKNTNHGADLYGDKPGNSLTPQQMLGAYNDGLWGKRRVGVDYKDFPNRESADQWAKTMDRNFADDKGHDFYTNDTTPDQYHYDIPRIPLAIPYKENGTDYHNFLQEPNLLQNYYPYGPQPTEPNTPSVTIPGQPPVQQQTPANPANPFGGFNMPWNGQEKLSTALPFLTAFMHKDQYPMLQQIHTPGINLDRVSNAQELSDMRQQSSLSQNELFNNQTGKSAYINSAALRADMINNMMRSNAQNNNVNTQISNQEDMTNYQTMINDRNFNVQELGKNFDQTNTVLGRRQKELSDGFAQSINNGIGVQDKLDALKQTFTQAAMKSVDKNNQPRFLLDPNTRTPILNPNWHGDILNNPFIGSGTDQSGYQKLMMKGLTDALNSGDIRAKTYAASVIAKLMKPDSKGNSAYDELYGR